MGFHYSSTKTDATAAECGCAVLCCYCCSGHANVATLRGGVATRRAVLVVLRRALGGGHEVADHVVALQDRALGR
eukprot:COSAG06_NODE_12288_length_1399_cov_1.397692_1_plen_74_part_10